MNISFEAAETPSQFVAMLSAAVDHQEDGGDATQQADEAPVPLSRIDQFAVVKTIGTRMREARELCGMSLTIAAERLGYKNPSKLSKIEGATDTNSVPVWTIRRAAEIYEVSTDYLFGLTADWEVGMQARQERAVSRWLFNAFEQARARDLAELVRLHERLDALALRLPEIALAAERTDEALRRVADLNRTWEQEIRGGARLMVAVEKLLEVVRTARKELNAFQQPLGL